MKRKLIAFSTSLALLLSVLIVTNVTAHPVMVDNSRQEWFGQEPLDPGTGIIRRNTANQGEFIFNDAKGDQRIVTTQTVTRSADLDWFGVTADTTSIYFLAKMERIPGVTQSPTPELMISIDSDHSGTANIQLPDTVGISVTAQAEWENVVQTQFTPSNPAATPKMFRDNASSTNCSGCAARLVGASNQTLPGSFIEIKVPWSNITGGKPTPDEYLRFTVSTYYSGHPVPGDGGNSALIDALGIVPTATEDDDGDIDTFFDLHFATNGEVFAPLQITEFLANPLGNDDSSSQGTEWIEIYNPNSFTVQLSDYKIGDAAQRGGSSEGMFKFPSFSLASGKTVVVAKDKSKLTADPGVAKVFNLSELTSYGSWATGTTIGLDNQRDQILLLDGSDTIVDIVDYTTQGNPNPTYPGLTPIVFPPEGVPESNDVSQERCPPNRDTDNAEVDFLEHSPTTGSQPTPGAPCPATTGVDLEILKTASASELLAGSKVTYFINWSNLDPNTNISSVIVSDTLPANLSFDSQSSSGGVFTPSPGPGQPMTWTFVFSSTTTNISGTIVLTATIKEDAPSNTALVNTAQIAENDPVRTEDPTKLENNTATAEVFAIKPDLSVSSTWPTAALPGSEFEYTITYSNVGRGDAEGVVVTDTLPSGVTFVSSTPAPDSSSTANTKVWTIGDLAAGASGTITVRVRINNDILTNTQLNNTVSISGTTPDDDTTNNTQTRTLTVGEFKLYLPIVIRS
jgi:uncharacterized repeat protein (TIGR01451 family)